jgi:hypothetical protein
MSVSVYAPTYIDHSDLLPFHVSIAGIVGRRIAFGIDGGVHSIGELHDSHAPFDQLIQRLA